MAVTIFHNPNCGTSRNVLAALREAGAEPRVVEYLRAGWTRSQLKELFGRMGVTPREALRVRGTPAEALGLTKPGVGDDAIIEAMVANPVLVERPIVDDGAKAALCRPADRVKAFL